MSGDAEFHAPAADPVFQVFASWRQFITTSQGVQPTHIVLGERTLERLSRSIHLLQFDAQFDKGTYLTHIYGMEVVRAKAAEALAVGVLL